MHQLYLLMGYIIGLTLFEEEVFVVQLRHDGRAGKGVSGCGAREREEHGVLAQERSLDSEGVVAGRVFLYLHQSVHSLHRAEYLYKTVEEGKATDTYQSFHNSITAHIWVIICIY